MPSFQFDNTYAALPERFYARLGPEPVAGPRLIRANHWLCKQLGIDATWLESAEGVEVAAGNRLPEGAAPIAAAYAGHQFGSFNPRLGDGRAILLGELLSPSGQRYDLQLKGSGRTPYSRGGDGRSPLGPVLREYIVSEAMAALGVPTTRSLAVTLSGETVLRERPLPGGVLVRVAQSHIRIGTFEYFAVRGDTEALGLLVEHVLRRHYPQAQAAERPALALLQRVAEAQAALIARWQLVGFIHGVMNTDNMLLSGETIDYGPCAFMDAYDPATVFSAIDRGGRYAYGNQPRIAQWNIACFAQALLPVMGADDARVIAAAQQVIDEFPAKYARAYEQGMARKLGLSSAEPQDASLADDLLKRMHQTKTDFTLTFRALSDLATSWQDVSASGQEPVGELFTFPTSFDPWLKRWRERIARDPMSAGERARSMRAANPALIARNHLVQAAIDDAVESGDHGRFHRLVEALSAPYAYHAQLAPWARPPRPEEQVHQTFCGT